MTPPNARHPSQFPTIFTLPSPHAVLEVAAQCRSAFLAFLNGVALNRWGCDELAAWLSGPYQSVTRVSAEIASTEQLQGSRVSSSDSAQDAEAVEQLIVQAHRECLNVVRSLIDPEQGTGFAFKLVNLQVLMRCEDGNANCGWVPIAKASMRLADRVQSLIAVDFLTRPEDYDALLTLCGRCGTVEFDAMSRFLGLCRTDHQRLWRQSETDRSGKAGSDQVLGGASLSSG